MNVQPAGLAHAALLAALHAPCFSDGWPESAFRDLLAMPGAFALLAADGGFILCRQAADEAEIITLAVLPERRRAGLGRTLVEAARAEAARRGAATMFLEVAADNPAARVLYESLGFREAGRRKGYYARPGGPAVDALVLVTSCG
ncbi:MAG: GNAT family N-acetyltransferase [Magnetospirillum sp. WYHS-4]